MSKGEIVYDLNRGKSLRVSFFKTANKILVSFIDKNDNIMQKKDNNIKQKKDNKIMQKKDDNSQNQQNNSFKVVALVDD